MNEEKRSRGRPRKEPRTKRSLDLPLALDAAMLKAAERAGKSPHAFMLDAVAQASGWSAAEPPVEAEQKAKPQPKAPSRKADLTPEPPRSIVSGVSLPAGARLKDPGRK